MGVRVDWPYQGGPELLKDSFGGRLDAIFDTTGHGGIAPKDRRQFAVRATFNGGCQSAGEGSVPHTPSAVIRVLGRTHTIQATGPTVAFVGTSATDCDTE